MWYLVHTRLSEVEMMGNWVVQPLNLLSIWTRALETEWLHDSSGLIISQWVASKDLEFNEKSWGQLVVNLAECKSINISGPFQYPLAHEVAARWNTTTGLSPGECQPPPMNFTEFPMNFAK